MLEILTPEIFYCILDFLDPIDINNLYLTSSKIQELLKKYVVKLVFVNHSEKVNTFFKFEYEYYIKNKNKIANIINQILVNDFFYTCRTPNLFLNMMTRIDIDGYAVFEFYVSLLKNKNYYIFPMIDTDYYISTGKLLLQKYPLQPQYEIYYADDINIYNIIKEYVTPKKEYVNKIYYNTYLNLINSNLI